MQKLDVLRKEIANIIGINYAPNLGGYKIISETQEQGYIRKFIEYGKDNISAYLLIPDKKGLNPAVLIHHQHNGQRHLGKSEVCGLTGNPLQSFD